MRTLPLALSIVVCLPLHAQAKPKASAKGAKAAKVHVDKAAKAHKAGDFEAALVELQTAYALDPQPKLLFGIAQVQAKLDNCNDALITYQLYLSKEKDKQKQAVVKQAMEACKTRLAERTAAGESAAEATAEPPPVDHVDEPPPRVSQPSEIVDDLPPGLPRARLSAPTAVERRGSPWYRDVLGDVLVLGGVAAGVAASVYYVRARGDLDAGERASTIVEYDQLVERAHDRRTIAVILAGGGAVLLGVGILRYALRDRGEQRGIAIAPAPGGGLITWGGGF
jgi:uncharacterized membrane protein YidH (DUF202 family)